MPDIFDRLASEGRAHAPKGGDIFDRLAAENIHRTPPPAYRPVFDPNAAARQMETEITQGKRQGPVLPGRITREQLLRNILASANEAHQVDENGNDRLDVDAVKIGLTPRGKLGLVHKSRREMIEEDWQGKEFVAPSGDPGGIQFGSQKGGVRDRKTGYMVGSDKPMIETILNMASPNLGAASVDPETTKGAHPLSRLQGALFRAIASQTSPDAMDFNAGASLVLPGLSTSGAVLRGSASPLVRGAGLAMQRGPSAAFAGSMGKAAYDQYAEGHGDDALITAALAGIAGWHASGAKIPETLSTEKLAQAARGEASLSPKMLRTIGKLLDIPSEALQDTALQQRVARHMLDRSGKWAENPVPLPGGIKAQRIRAREAEAAAAQQRLQPSRTADAMLEAIEQAPGPKNALTEAINAYEEQLNAALVDRQARASKIGSPEYYVPEVLPPAVEHPNPYASPDAQQSRILGYREGPQGQVERINAADQWFRENARLAGDPAIDIRGSVSVGDLASGRWPGEVAEPRIAGEAAFTPGEPLAELKSEWLRLIDEQMNIVGDRHEDGFPDLDLLSPDERAAYDALGEQAISIYDQVHARTGDPFWPAKELNARAAHAEQASVAPPPQEQQESQLPPPTAPIAPVEPISPIKPIRPIKLNAPEGLPGEGLPGEGLPGETSSVAASAAEGSGSIKSQKRAARLAAEQASSEQSVTHAEGRFYADSETPSQPVAHQDAAGAAAEPVSSAAPSGLQLARVFVADRLSRAAKTQKQSERLELLRGTAPDVLSAEYGISRQAARALVNEIADVTEGLEKIVQKMKRTGLSAEDSAQLHAAYETLMKKLSGGELFSGPGILFDAETVKAAVTVLKFEAKRLGVSLKTAAERLVDDNPNLLQHFDAALAQLTRGKQHLIEPAEGTPHVQLDGIAEEESNAIPRRTGGVRDKAKSVVALTRDGRFRQTYAVDKTAGDLVNSLAAAQETGALKGVHAAHRVLEGLSPEQKEALGELLVGRRLRSVNPAHEQAVSVKRENQIASDPAVLDAAVRYAKEVKPAIEALRKKAGLTESAADANPDSFFISLMKHAVDENGQPISLSESGEVLPAPPNGSLSSRTRQSDTVHSKQAKGTADRYVTDVEHLIRESFGEVAPKAAMHQLYKHLIENGLVHQLGKIGVGEFQSLKSAKAKLAELEAAHPMLAFDLKTDGDAIELTAEPKTMPHQILIGGKTYPLTRVEISRYGVRAADGSLVKDILAPKGIAEDIAAVVAPPSGSPWANALRGLQGAVTATQLTGNPKEMINHVRRISRVLSALPPADRSSGVRVAEALVPYIGPKVGTWMRLIGTDMSLPENQAILQEIFEANGGSGRPFQHYELKGGLLGIGAQVGKAQRFSHNLLFGVPFGKGILGYDLRVRVAAEKIRRAVEGNTDPKRIREFANQFGQYSSHPDDLIRLVKSVNPFAATNLPLRLTELRQILGGSGLHGGSIGEKGLRRAETLWRGMGGTVLAMVLLNKALSGKYPWDNSPGRQYDLNVGRDADGRSVYLKPQALDPVFARVVNTFGLPGIDAEADSRVAKRDRDYAAPVTTGLINQGLNVVSSPLSNSVLVGATGHAAYFVRQPGKPRRLLSVVRQKSKPGESSSTVRNLKAGVLNLNPLGEMFTDHEEREKLYRQRMKVLRSLTWPLGNVVRKPAR